MSILSTIQRRLSRASFVDVLPVSAFVLSFILASIFTVFYQVEWRRDYNRQANVHANHVIELVTPALLRGDYEEVQLELDILAPRGGTITTRSGETIISANTTELQEFGRRYKIRDEKVPVADMVLVPIAPFRPPLPYGLAFALILGCATIATLMIRILTKVAAKHLQIVQRYVDSYDEERLQLVDIPPVSFKEFRGLNAVALMTTRRLKNEIKRYRNLARRDERTGLPNRYDFDQHLQAALDLATEETPYAVLMLRIDNWPSQRNRFNYGDAETAIRIIGEKVKAAVSDPDVMANGLHMEAFARTGEQTFTILVSGLTSRDDLSVLVRALRADLSKVLEIGDVSLTPEIAGSIALIPHDGDTVQRVFHALQITLQSLTTDGKSGYMFYSPKLDRQNDARRKLEIELREALEANAFIPVYQPKINLRTGRIHGVEALARWKLASGRLASPNVFIGLAEDLGLIDEIGEQIMRKATKDAADWMNQGQSVNLAVNVSPIQFNDERLTQMILSAIADSGLPPRLLELEITESVAVTQPEKVRSILAPLRKLGVKLAVDDFGTGHSNLAILTQFQFDTFKIDRQFVGGTPHDPQANAIVEMMLGMAKTLKMEIVGEGVETAQQAQYLAKRGCHIGQGYYFSKPVPVEELASMLGLGKVRKAG